MQATRNMTGQKGVEKTDSKTNINLQHADIDPTVTRIQFEPKDYRVNYLSINILL